MIEKEAWKIVLFTKTKLNSIEVSVSKTLIDWYISHDEFGLVNNVLKEYDDVKEEIKNLKISTVHQIYFLFINKCYRTVWSVEKKR